MDISLSEITNMIPLVFKSNEKNENQNDNVPAKDSINGKPAEPPRDYFEDIISLGSEQPDAESSTLAGKMPFVENELFPPSSGTAPGSEPTIPLPEDAYTPSLGNNDAGTLPVLEGMYDMSGKKILNNAPKNNMPLPNAVTLQNTASIPLSELKDASLSMLSAYSLIPEENGQPVTLLNNGVLLPPEYAELKETAMQNGGPLPLLTEEFTQATVPLPAGQLLNPSAPISAELVPDNPLVFFSDELINTAAPIVAGELPEPAELIQTPVKPEASLPFTPQKSPLYNLNTRNTQADPLLTALMREDSALGWSEAEAFMEVTGMTQELLPGEKPLIEPRLPNYSAAFSNGVNEEAEPSEILLRNIKLNSGKAFSTSMLEEAASSARAGTLGQGQRLPRELPYSLYLFGNLAPQARKYADEEYEISLLDSDGNKTAAGYLRISDAIKMACIVHNLYYGERVSFVEGIPWYGVYVEYALSHKIISEGDFENYTSFATREEMTYIFANAVPRTELFPRNNLPLPLDVSEFDKFGRSVSILLRAGVLAERASGGNFNPDDNISPTEASIIMGRIVNPALRNVMT